jgi:N-acetylglucosaminyldiphosphoundecaprenol N-acetyl-beta-D-mannosaminyltransferase
MVHKATVDILGVRIDVVTKQKLNSLIMSRVKSGHHNPLVVFKPYVEFLSLADRNENIRKLLNKSDINAPDSVALQWAASYLYGKPTVSPGFIHAYYSLIVRMQNRSWLGQVLPERMAGVDQTLPLLRLADKGKLKIGVLGGPKDTASTEAAITKRFKNISLRVWNGYFGPNDEKAVVRQIASAKVDILFVCLGFPKQEKFIIEYRNRLNAKVIIGEGGSFDYDQLGGNVRRAPAWMKSIGLEWLWRLMIQPRRLKRQFAIPSFICRVRQQKSGQK